MPTSNQGELGYDAELEADVIAALKAAPTAPTRGMSTSLHWSNWALPLSVSWMRIDGVGRYFYVHIGPICVAFWNLG